MAGQKCCICAKPTQLSLCMNCWKLYKDQEKSNWMKALKNFEQQEYRRDNRIQLKETSLDEIMARVYDEDQLKH